MRNSTSILPTTRSLLSWVLRVAAWALVLGCGLGLMTGMGPGSSQGKWLTVGVWTGLGIYLVVLIVDLITRLRGVRQRSTGMEGRQ